MKCMIPRECHYLLKNVLNVPRYIHTMVPHQSQIMLIAIFLKECIFFWVKMGLWLMTMGAPYSNMYLENSGSTTMHTS